MTRGPELDLRATAELLRDTFPTPVFAGDAYLRWLYLDNPVGRAIVGDVDEAGTMVAHLGLVPQVWRSREGESGFLLALNAVHAVRKYVRGRESAAKAASRERITLASLAGGLYEQAGRAGYVGVFGVPNARSTSSFVRKQGFRLIRPLPVRACLPVPSWRGRVESFDVDARFLRSERFDELVAGLDDLPVDRWVQRASPQWLRWRLARPLASYALHRGPAGIAISTAEVRGGARFAIILKLFPRRDAAWDGRTRIRAHDLVFAACRFHGTPFAVYAGFNRHMDVWGLPVPRRFLPAPLNLTIRSLSPGLDQTRFEVDTYEFLDGDQY